jgi:hypothetical protein
MVTIAHKFVKHIPEKTDEGILYISMEFSTAIHRCCCGCGQEVVTPFSPDTWHLIFDGKTVSLNPSVGSWQFVCRSHYFITRNKIRWLGSFLNEPAIKSKKGARKKKEDSDGKNKRKSNR